jgi:hypothetical protein
MTLNLEMRPIVWSILSFVLGYFIPNNAMEKAIEFFIKEETGIVVDFRPDAEPCPPPLNQNCGDPKTKK